MCVCTFTCECESQHACGGQKIISGVGSCLPPGVRQGLLLCLLLHVPGQLTNTLLGSLLSFIPISMDSTRFQGVCYGAWFYVGPHAYAAIALTNRAPFPAPQLGFYGSDVECFPQTHIFLQLVPDDSSCFGRLWNILDMTHSFGHQGHMEGAQ